MKQRYLLLVLSFVSAASQADTTYTPQQLRSMISSGSYPEQGPVTDTKTKPSTFDACKVSIEAITSQFRDSYPVRTIVDTSLLYTVKIWVNDAAMTVSCSSPDEKMVITQAPYK